MIIIPDVHGRTFWKEAVKGHEDEEIIFLGDYTDPYVGFEPVELEDGIKALQEIIEFKKQHMDNVILLLGNHDLSYIINHVFKCRHDIANHYVIKDLILSHKQLFCIVYDKWIGRKRFLFSHAGILKDWLKNNERTIGAICIGDEVERLNEMFHDGSLNSALGDVSSFRGGDCEVGSCVLADVREHIYNNNVLLGCYQVFGHTNLSGGPLITDTFACVDCMKGIMLTDDGEFIVMNNNKSE